MSLLQYYSAKLRIFLMVLALSVGSCVMAMESDSFDDDDDEFDISFDAMQQYQEENAQALTTRGLGPGGWAAFLTKYVKIKEPLWKSTKAPAGRDVLYLLPHKITSIEYGGLAINSFFNMTNRMSVTANDIVNFEQVSLDAIAELLPPGMGVEEIARLLPLFRKITLQERRSGFLIQAGFIKGPFTLQLNTSLLMAERNFWLSNQDQQLIKSFFKGDAAINDSEGFKIIVGMGDTRLKLGLNTLNMTSFQNDVGIEVILPTSLLSSGRKLKLGVIQAPFEDEPEALQGDGVNAISAVRDNLITPPLGNGGHFGIGCYFESKIGIFNELAQLWLRGSYDILLPGKEDLMFIFTQTMPWNDLSTIPAGDMSDAAKIKVNNGLNQYLFPSSFRSTVQPGGIVNFVAAVSRDFTEHWTGAFGYDFYAQQKSFVTALHNTTVALSQLNVDIAVWHYIEQHKIFTEVLYHSRREKSDFGLGVGGDLTVGSSKEIGQDWTAYVKFTSAF